MNEVTLTHSKIEAGIWHGVLAGAVQKPQLCVRHLKSDVPGISVNETQDHGVWLVQVPIPPEIISDGIHTLVILDATTGQKLNSISLIAGDALEDDLRAEIDLLRAELDMLKHAFRRHCHETG